MVNMLWSKSLNLSLGFCLGLSWTSFLNLLMTIIQYMIVNLKFQQEQGILNKNGILRKNPSINKEKIFKIQTYMPLIGCNYKLYRICERHYTMNKSRLCVSIQDCKKSVNIFFLIFFNVKVNFEGLKVSAYEWMQWIYPVECLNCPIAPWGI